MSFTFDPHVLSLLLFYQGRRQKVMGKCDPPIFVNEVTVGMLVKSAQPFVIKTVKSVIFKEKLQSIIIGFCRGMYHDYHGASLKLNHLGRVVWQRELLSTSVN